ncbi:uncharacterized protein LOC123704152 isoform X2 [Colias croceus]|uniref:uncharacterized protein LOC123704152 isoform X2 n=1 Tax=Colias crocea TaxID=72248 RepID=UPI001E280E20|nr:uncharacterized protein LOC123704152 isoform X2 [Colias croceus]XP_045508407.1 uncharacterized protein LOC123704152 isoform X2 [Colias croceus]
MDTEQKIGEVVTEAVKNSDVVSMLQQIVATSPSDGESEEIREKIQNVLERYNNMDEVDKEVFVNQLKEALAMKLSMKLRDNVYEDGPSYVPVLIAALLIFLVVVFFGYKLYKSIKEKEKKREEKKKQKQMKKKK